MSRNKALKSTGVSPEYPTPVKQDEETPTPTTLNCKYIPGLRSHFGFNNNYYPCFFCDEHTEPVYFMNVFLLMLSGGFALQLVSYILSMEHAVFG